MLKTALATWCAAVAPVAGPAAAQSASPHARAVAEVSRALSTRAVLMLAVAALLAACMPRGDDKASSARPPDMHNSRNALDWPGTYAGVTPCADCPGIEMRLRLQLDGNYELSTRYQDRQVAPQTVQGRFSWDAAGNTITLDAAGSGQQFRVGEGRLLQLDRDGTAPSWNTPYRVLTLQGRK